MRRMYQFAQRLAQPVLSPQMFPIRDDNPQILVPYATYVIIGLNAIVWVFVQGLGTTLPLASSVCSYGVVPAQLLQALPANASVPLGSGLECILGSGPDWHRSLTSMFMHGGWMHIIGNMWFLWIFGNNVEDAMGTLRFVVFYLLCGLVAVAFQVASNPASAVPMVGASGAIGGVMGAYIMLYPRVHVHMLIFLGFYVTTLAVPAALMLAYWLLIQLLSGVISLGGQAGGTAFWAHIGGFVAGLLLIFPFRDRKLLARHPYYGWRPRRSPTRSWHRINRR